jgi:hypothetical protein
MAFSWGDSFDCYAAPADMLLGYWDSGASVGTLAFVAGRFSGSRALWHTTGANIVKSSAVNDAVHHLIVAFQQGATITGTTLGAYLELFDGTTAQCSVVFRSDGAILLTSGAPNSGTTLATYTGAVTTSSTWYAFEFEIIISNTVGRFRVRKNGNPVDDFDSGATLDTQNSANAYANKLQVGQQTTVTASYFDDLYWRSDASSVAWMGDIRCYTRAPASDASVQFSHAPLTLPQTLFTTTTTSAKTANTVTYAPFVPSWSGTITGVDIGCNVATAHMKAAIYNSALTTALVTSTEVTNPVAYPVLNLLTFSPPVTVTAGTTYYLAVNQDASVTYRIPSGLTVASTGTTTYASFPAASPAGLTSGQTPLHSIIYIQPSANYPFVNEAQQDATTSYVYDSVPGHADLYGIAAIASTPLTTYAVTTRAYMIKSDAGTRTAAVQLKSGSSTVASPTVVLTPSNWQWAWRTDTVDPQTGTAWTAAAVNTINVGPVVIA